MKTIREALIDQIGNSLSLVGMGRIENILISRGLNGEDGFTAEIYKSPSFIGAQADCLLALVDVPNISESDLSITLPDRNVILKKANFLYSTIGEKEVPLDQPKIYVGSPD